jgi:hypothetical protein
MSNAVPVVCTVTVPGVAWMRIWRVTCTGCVYVPAQTTITSPSLAASTAA